MEAEKEGGKLSPWPSLACFFFCFVFFFFFYPAGHLFPVCNMTPAPSWVLLFLRCVRVCITVGSVVSCRANAASHLRWYELACVLSCD